MSADAAVLVAIAIPVFTAQLEKSREATDAANIRAAYAEIMSEAIAGEKITAAKDYGVYKIDATTGSEGSRINTCVDGSTRNGGSFNSSTSFAIDNNESSLSVHTADIRQVNRFTALLQLIGKYGDGDGDEHGRLTMTSAQIVIDSSGCSRLMQKSRS